MLRAATSEEVARVYGADAEHIVGEAGGEAVAYIGFKRIEGRLWGIYQPMAAAAPSVWNRLFYAFRRELRQQNEPVYVLARDAAAGRLLRLLRLAPADETFAGKDVWKWTPEHYI